MPHTRSSLWCTHSRRLVCVFFLFSPLFDGGTCRTRVWHGGRFGRPYRRPSLLSVLLLPPCSRCFGPEASLWRGRCTRAHHRHADQPTGRGQSTPPIRRDAAHDAMQNSVRVRACPCRSAQRQNNEGRKEGKKKIWSATSNRKQVGQRDSAVCSEPGAGASATGRGADETPRRTVGQDEATTKEQVNAGLGAAPGPTATKRRSKGRATAHARPPRRASSGQTANWSCSCPSRW